MNSDMAVGCLMGFIAGALMMLFAMKMLIRSIAGNLVRSVHEENGRRDPANWWKYGDPNDEYEPDNEE